MRCRMPLLAIPKQSSTPGYLSILMTTRRSRSSGVIVTILLCILAVRYGPAIGGLLYTKWEVRNAPELWIVPTPLSDLSINRSPGKKFSYIGYEFESPWTEVKKERQAESIATLNFSGGEVISISKGTDVLRAMKQEARKRGADIRDVFGDQVAGSNYAMRSKILYLTPRDLRLFSPPRQMVANSILLSLKKIYTGAAKGRLYSFQTEWVRGFQEGDTARNNVVTIYAFDEQDREIVVFVGTEPNTGSKPTQADINRILYSLRPVPPSLTK
jgi:hypothetical protein